MALLLAQSACFAVQLDKFKINLSEGDLSKKLRSLPSTLQDSAQKAAADTIKAITELEAFFEEEYTPHARQVSGCTSLPAGNAVYAHCLA